MKNAATRCALVAVLLAGSMPASAQLNSPFQGSGGPGKALPPSRAKAAPAPSRPTVVQSGLGGAANGLPVNVTATPDCDNGGHRNHRSSAPVYSNAHGFPEYPGPDVPLPAPGSYYATPHDYYDSYNPYNPYGYHQNGGFYNPGYYNSEFNGGYYNGGYQPTQNPWGSGFPPFQGYSTGSGRTR